MLNFSFPDLPLTEVLPSILENLKNDTRLVLEAPPGAGKTTLVPLALLAAEWRKDDKIIVLEPRRLAARAAASRMAQIIGEPIGKTVGYRVRLENKISSMTRIEVVTEGILTRMLQDDPTLEGIAAVIFDEFHERNLQADLGLALALSCQSILRPDLRLILMSATLDTENVASWFKAPNVKSEGRMFPVSIQYLPTDEVQNTGTAAYQRMISLVPKAIKRAFNDHQDGDILVFLPGLGELKKVSDILERANLENVEIHLLHGDLSLQQQQMAIGPSAKGKRKIILSTSIAETSITIEGVSIVVDGGYSRVSKFIPRSGLTTLVTVPVSKAAADQRSGRAGRLRPGFCYRVWSKMEQHQLPDKLTPEIKEADLSGLALELALWGVKEASELQWLDPPPTAAMAQARDLLVQLEAITHDTRPLPHGKTLAALGMQPRLGHLVIKGQQIHKGATACAMAALLSEKDIFKASSTIPGSIFHHPDVRLRLEALLDLKNVPMDIHIDQPILMRVQKQANFLKQKLHLKEHTIVPDAAGLLLALAYPDRIGQLEANGKIRLRSGLKLILATEFFEKAAFFAVSQLDLRGAKVLLAAPLKKNDLLELFKDQVQIAEEIFWDYSTERIASKKLSRLGALILEDTPIKDPEQEAVVGILLKVIVESGLSVLSWTDSALQIRQRMAFLHFLDQGLWPDVSDGALLKSANEWLRPYLYNKQTLEEIKKLDLGAMLLNLLSYHQRREMDDFAPSHIEVPSGSRVAIDYAKAEAPVLAVRLQEVFGLLETPKIAKGRVSLLIHLLSPARRPVQITKDLPSFWKNGYFQVRKDLRAQYPKHAWPEDPLTAQAIKGIKKKNKP